MKKLISPLFIVLGLFITINAASQDLDKKTTEIHNRALVIDTHCDTPMLMVRGNFDVGVKNSAPKSRVDFPRMKEGGVDAMFFAAFTGQTKRTPENYQKVYEMANNMIDATYAACKK